MSSTNRGRGRNTLDQYETPWEAVAPLLPHLVLPAGAIDLLDPCCGTGAMVWMVGLTGAKFGMKPRGIELDPNRPATPGLEVQTADALTVDWGSPDLIVTNPPYVLAMEFVLRGVAEAKRGATVAMLLRLAFLASLSRAAFHGSHPADVFVLAKRPSFTGGQTDSTDYAWFVWGPGRGGRWNVLLPRFPRELELPGMGRESDVP